ncbi:Protein Wnt-7b [Nymphon striatum]|nr:Protein Wnt-7b [Nymphon striatum]
MIQEEKNLNMLIPKIIKKVVDTTHYKPMVSAIRAATICSKIPGFTPKQRKMCQTRPDAIVAVGDGAKLALNECQHQFYKHRWNCSAIGTNYLFEQQSSVGSKEAAYTTAVKAAGVTYKITASCSKGSLSRCSCDPNKGHSLHNNYIYSDSGSWKWGGCSDHIKYGMSTSLVEDACGRTSSSNSGNSVRTEGNY